MAIRATKTTITFTCTACRTTASIRVYWREHHRLPRGWRSRDLTASAMLPRRTDHIFACGKDCLKKLDKRCPPPSPPRWFVFA
jgi:hypothetical protein